MGVWRGMANFTPLPSFAGGVLIGASALAMLLVLGRIAGVSGILEGVVRPSGRDETPWRAAFLAGLVAGGAAFGALVPGGFEIGILRSPAALVLAGLLVGFGTRLGSGCTSGHGVCGMSRLSPRSILATLVFMATGAVTVFVVNRLLGGSA
jgi:hypothetical protein